MWIMSHPWQEEPTRPPCSLPVGNATQMDMSVTEATHRRDAAPPTLPEARRRFGFLVSGTAMVLLIAAVAAPSPVYPLYQTEWHLAPVTLTAMFAIYVAGLLVVLLTAGSLSDFVGRRPVIVAASLISIAGLVLLAIAPSAGWVMVARVVQGVSMALAVGALGAALLDFAPPGRARLAAMLNGSLPPIGLALGALVGSGLVEFGPDPTRLVYVIIAVLVALVTVPLCFLPERNERRPGALASLAPTVALPAEVRGIFVAVLGCLLASWALGGLYLGMGASIVRSVFDIQAAVVGGVAIAVVTGIGALTGILTQRQDALRVMLTGGAALIVGPLLMVLSVTADLPWLFFVSSVVGGVGFGAGFQGGLRMIVAESPAADRAGVLSSVYLVCYLSFGVPCLVAGLLTPSLGLTTVIVGYTVFVCLLAALAMLLQLTRASARRSELLADADDAADR